MNRIMCLMALGLTFAIAGCSSHDANTGSAAGTQGTVQQNNKDSLLNAANKLNGDSSKPAKKDSTPQNK